MRTLLHAIAAVTEALQDPTAEISFNVDPGAGTSVSTSATPQKVKATFISLVNLFGEPFFDAMENPMENGFDSSAVWEFSDSEGGAYTLSDNPHSENLDEISEFFCCVEILLMHLRPLLALPAHLAIVLDRNLFQIIYG